jgi:acetyl esterase/lipase
MIPPDLLDLSDIPAARQIAAQLLEQMADQLPEVEGVTAHDRQAPGPDGDPAVPVRIYRPDGAEGSLPAMLWIHGGGMVLGNIDQDDLFCKALAKEVDCTVVSVEYRLAPEHPYPAPLEDCYAALRWLVSNADEIGADASRIAIGGASAGGGLAAGLALLARDRGEVTIAFQLLIYPMVDDRNMTPSSHAITHPSVWNRDANIAGWRAYLGGEIGADDVPPYAAPARASDLSGLPPAYIAVGELDLFLDEDVEYGQRLLQAGVTTELHVYPGAFHGSDTFVAGSELSQRWVSDRNDALRRALA